MENDFITDLLERGLNSRPPEYPGPRFQRGLCKKYCKASDRLIECEECEKRFHTSCSKFGDDELLRIESGDGAWYCSNCKADWSLQWHYPKWSQSSLV